MAYFTKLTFHQMVVNYACKMLVTLATGPKKSMSKYCFSNFSFFFLFDTNVSRAQCYIIFDNCNSKMFLEKARVFDPGRPFHPSLMFESKALPYPSQAPFRRYTLGQAAGAVFTTLHFLHKFVLHQIGQSVTLHKVENACQGQTLQLTGLIRKLGRQ